MKRVFHSILDPANVAVLHVRESPCPVMCAFNPDLRETALHASSQPARTDAPGADDTQWFVEEVHPNEPSLRSYLRGTFPTVRDIDDVVQESYLRIWRAHALHPIRSARDFLFGIARRVAVDRIRRDRSAGHESVTELHALRALKEEASPAETVSRRQEISLLIEAIDALPARCREIIMLRKLDGLSHDEIAQRLGISAETVQVQLGRGMDKCARFLRGHGVKATRGAPRKGTP